MSILSVVAGLLGFAKKNLGKWLPIIFAAEQKFKSATGEQKFAMIKGLLDKEATKYLRKLQQEINKKGLAFAVNNDEKINALAGKGETMVKAVVDYYNTMDALLPHSK